MIHSRLMDMTALSDDELLHAFQSLEPDSDALLELQLLNEIERRNLDI